MKAYGIDTHNQNSAEEVMHTLRSAGGGDSVPKVLIVKGDENTDRKEILRMA